jgi:hypothetical protein
VTRYFSVTGLLKLKPVWTQSFGTATDVSDRADIAETLTMSSDTPDLYADSLWKDGITATTTSAEIDLSALDQKGFGGTGTLAFENILAVYVKNAGENDALVFGTPSQDRWDGLAGGAVRLKPNSVLYVTAPGSGWPVTTASRLVEFSAASGTTTLEFLFIGVLA